MFWRYCVVGLGPHPRRRVRRRDHQPVLVLVVDQREVVPLPVPVRAGAVEAEDERHLLARFQIARIVEEVGAPGLHLDHVALVDHHRRRALGVRAVKVGRGGAGGAFEAERLFCGGHRGDRRERQIGIINQSPVFEVTHSSQPSTVDVPAMSNFHHANDGFGIVDSVDDSEGSHATNRARPRPASDCFISPPADPGPNRVRNAMVCRGTLSRRVQTTTLMRERPPRAPPRRPSPSPPPPPDSPDRDPP